LEGAGRGESGGEKLGEFRMNRRRAFEWKKEWFSRREPDQKVEGRNEVAVESCQSGIWIPRKREDCSVFRCACPKG